MSSVVPAPRDLGFRYADWRPGQRRAIVRILTAEAPLVLTMPTGLGKSAVYVAAAMLSGARTIVVTATRALQDQLIRDFGHLGLVAIKGRRNYRCRLTGGTADRGPCLLWLECPVSERCHYLEAVKRARRSRLVVTNYAYHLLGDLGPAELLVLDEAHEAPEAVASTLSCRVDLQQWCRALGDDLGSPGGDWGSWVRAVRARLLARREEALDRGDLVRLRNLAVVANALDLLRVITKHEVVVVGDHRAFEVHPVEVRPFVGLLTKGSGQLVLTSATANAKTSALLGLEAEVAEFEDPGPAGRRPVYVVGTGPRLAHHRWDCDRDLWVTMVDQTIRSRLRLKGLIHTGSYDRARVLAVQSSYRSSMITHGPSGATAAIERFRGSRPPAILVSPAMVSGVDLPYDTCEWIVIGKVAFINPTDPVNRARTAADPEYPYYLACQDLVQASGRGCRAPDDWCETVVIDSSASWLLRRYGHLVPGWFMKAVRWTATIPHRR